MSEKKVGTVSNTVQKSTELSTTPHNGVKYVTRQHVQIRDGKGGGHSILWSRLDHFEHPVAGKWEPGRGFTAYKAGDAE